MKDFLIGLLIGTNAIAATLFLYVGAMNLMHSDERWAPGLCSVAFGAFFLVTGYAMLERLVP